MTIKVEQLPVEEVDPVMSCLRTTIAIAGALLEKATGSSFSLMVIACEQGTSEVRLMTCCESPDIERGMAAVVARNVLKESE